MCVLPVFVVLFFNVYQNINYFGLYICTTLYCITLNGEASEQFCLSIPPRAILPSRLFVLGYGDEVILPELCGGLHHISFHLCINT